MRKTIYNIKGKPVGSILLYIKAMPSHWHVEYLFAAFLESAKCTLAKLRTPRKGTLDVYIYKMKKAEEKAKITFGSEKALLAILVRKAHTFDNEEANEIAKLCDSLHDTLKDFIEDSIVSDLKMSLSKITKELNVIRKKQLR